MPQLESQERPQGEITRQYLVDWYIGFLESYLLNEQQGSIPHTTFVLPEMACHEYVAFTGQEPGYRILDPEEFFERIFARDPQMAFHCLNILPVSVMCSMIQVLERQGKKKDSIYKALQGMIIKNEETSLVMNGEEVYPFGVGTRFGRTYSRIKSRGQPFHVGTPTGTEADVQSTLILLNQEPVNRGDFFYANFPVPRSKRMANDDSQNGVFLSGAGYGTPGGTIGVYAHLPENEGIAARRTSLAAIIARLYARKDVHGMSPEQVIQAGYISLHISEFDYLGFYQNLAHAVDRS